MKRTITLRDIREGVVSKIGLVGYGKSNAAVAKMIRRLSPSASLTLRSDADPTEINPSEFSRILIGKSAFTDISEDVLFFSPSVRRERCELLPVLRRDIPFSSDAELFLESFEPPIFAISGSDGKSTVTHLCAELTKHSLRSPPAGNYGLPLVELLDCTSLGGAVIELSSFQLQYANPRVFRGLITNISENHLNWHKDYEEYIAAKEKLVSGADEPMIFIGDEVCDTLAKKHHIHTAVSDGMKSDELSAVYSVEHTVTLEDGFICYDGVRVLEVSDIKRREKYNVRNFMSSVALSRGYTDSEQILSCARSFSGLPHRCEEVAIKNGVTFINSSIDTTPKRSASTILSLDAPLIVIVGGASKGLSYKPLYDALRAKARAVILTGASSAKLYGTPEIHTLGAKILVREDFEDAVRAAVNLAEQSDTVLLSPAHTSYDRFSSFEERGDLFKRIIKDTVG